MFELGCRWLQENSPRHIGEEWRCQARLTILLTATQLSTAEEKNIAPIEFIEWRYLCPRSTLQAELPCSFLRQVRMPGVQKLERQ